MYKLLWERLKRGKVHGQDKTLQFCETGFNAGHSSLFWLLYDDRISVTSFDIGSNSYVHAASNFLKSKFPNRFDLIYAVEEKYSGASLIYGRTAVNYGRTAVNYGRSAVRP